MPAQASREFARNRPTLLAQIHRQLSDARSHAMSGQFVAPPILHGQAEYANIRKAVSEIDAALKVYRTGMTSLMRSVERWRGDDPVLQVCAPLFDSDNVLECGLTDEELELVRAERFAKQIPPGYRDKSKDDGGVGDLATWLTILATCSARDSDGILVTEDSKDDWFHRAGETRLFPRYELLEESRERVPGRAFGIYSLSELLKAHGAPQPVVEQVATHERSSESRSTLSESEAVVSVANRLVAAFGQDAVQPIVSADFDVRVIVADGAIGVSVAILNRFKAAYGATRVAIERAQELARRNHAVEILVAIVAPTWAVAHRLETWFAAERFPTHRVGVLLLESREGSFVCRLCQSAIPEIRAAFPVAHARQD